MCASAIVTSQDVRCLVGLYFSLYIYILIVFFAHTDTASTPDATAVQRYPFLNKFSSRATARFQCWKSIYPLLKLLRCRGERWSRLLSNGRSHESASSRALWKEGEKQHGWRFPRVLATTCERPMAPKSVYTGRDKATVTIIELLCQYVINRARHQLERGFRPGLERGICRAAHASSVDRQHHWLWVLQYFVASRASGVDKVRATQMLWL